MSNIKLSIVLLTFNRLELTRQTIENLIQKTTVPYEFIIIDNGSNDGTRDYLLSLKYKTKAREIRYIFNRRNLGIAGGKNIGLLLARADVVCCMDNDILVPDKYDVLFLDACEKISKLGITGVNVEGVQYPITEVNGVKVQNKSDNLGGGCLCFPRRTIEKIGYFNTEYNLYGREDLDLFLRLQAADRLSLYIEPNGQHIDKNDNIPYAEAKQKIHKEEKSPQTIKFVENRIRYEHKENLYIPYRLYKQVKGDVNFSKLISSGPPIRGNPKIALVTHTHNCYRYLPQMFKSTISQTLSKHIWTHIIVDTASRDKSDEISLNLAEKHKNINCFRLNKILTKQEVYNFVLYTLLPQHFPYVEIFVILEPTDILPENALEVVYNTFEDNPSIAGVYSNFGVMNEKGKILRDCVELMEPKRDLNTEDGQKELRKVFMTENPCKNIMAFRPECLYDVGGFDTEHLYATDYSTYGKLLDRHRIIKINQVLYIARERNFDAKQLLLRAKSTRKMRKDFFDNWVRNEKI